MLRVLDSYAEILRTFYTRSRVLGAWQPYAEKISAALNFVYLLNRVNVPFYTLYERGVNKVTHKEKVVQALKMLGGHAYLKDIYDAFGKLNGDTPLALNYQAIVRSILERYSSDSTVFEGKENLFYSVDGIGNGHWGLLEYKNTFELSQDDDEFCEGKLLLKKHLQRERNPKLISTAKKFFIAKHGHLFCEVCGFDFKEKYGEIGENFIEAHHVKPISEMSDGDITKIEDIIMVCSNCHSMIHRKKPWLSKEDLKSILK